MKKKIKSTARIKGSLLKTLLLLVVVFSVNDAFAQLPFNPGIIASSNQTMCNLGDPNNIVFSTLPSPVSKTYQWYFRDGIIAAPAATATVTGWTIVSGATASSYDPQPFLATSRTFACRVTSGANSLWASGVRQVNVLPTINRGTIAAGNQAFNLSGNPGLITLSTIPYGGTGTFTYQWYSKLGIHSAPIGSAIPTGWSAIAGATSSSYDPPVQNQSITYALMVDPTGWPDCSGPVWSSLERKITIIVSSGTLAAGNQTLCYGGDPANITFSTPATSGVTYQWYFKDGIIWAPGTTGSTSGWTAIGGATASSYNPPAGLLNSRTYARRVINGPTSLWTSGVRQITISAFPEIGVTSFVGIPTELPQHDLMYFASGNPPPIKCNLSNPAGYTYEWYSFSGVSYAPNGASVPAGWTLIPGATTDTYDPPTITSTRSYACRVRYNGCYRWSTVGAIAIVTNQNFGQLAGGLRDTTCYGFAPDPITFSVAPAAGATVNWYRTPDLKSPHAPIGGADVFVGSGLTYSPLIWWDAGSTYPMNRFYTPRVTIGSTSYWLTPKYINVKFGVSTGDLSGIDIEEICSPALPSLTFSISAATGESNVFVYQWYVTDLNYTPSGFCERISISPTWSAIGSPFIVENSTASSDNYFYLSLPSVLPTITAPPMVDAGGNYNILSYKLQITPVNSATSLVPIISCNEHFCGPIEEVGPDLYTLGAVQVKYRQCGGSARYAAPGNELENVKSAFLGEAYPNPAAESFTIDYELPENSINAIVSLHDLSGKTIKQIELNGSTGRQQLNMTVVDLPSGMYFYSLEIDGNRQMTKRISVMH
jgi:Secretion system C-terminal sorting domain